MVGKGSLAKKMQNKITVPDLTDLDLPANPARECWEKCQSDWHALTPEEQAFAKLSHSEVWHRYQISQQYGKHTLNILMEGDKWTRY
jgi:hypothetical protein